jgi:uncharacterized protein YjeT (DUF2065 family)
MDLAVKIVGVFLILAGLLYLLRPQVVRSLTQFFIKGNRLYISAIVRLILAVLFLLSATKCTHPQIVGAFGVLFLLGGLTIFMAGPAKLKPTLTWFLARSPVWSRIAGIVIMAFGGIIVYAA